MNLNAPDVENAHPLPVGKGSKPSIIVRLRSRKIRDEILSKRKVLKGSGVSISEDLTKLNVQLMSQLRNDERVENTWSSNGRVYAKVRSSSRKLHIRMSETLSEVLSKLNIADS